MSATNSIQIQKSLFSYFNWTFSDFLALIICSCGLMSLRLESSKKFSHFPFKEKLNIQAASKVISVCSFRITQQDEFLEQLKMNFISPSLINFVCMIINIPQMYRINFCWINMKINSKFANCTKLDAIFFFCTNEYSTKDKSSNWYSSLLQTSDDVYPKRCIYRKWVKKCSNWQTGFSILKQCGPFFGESWWNKIFIFGAV